MNKLQLELECAAQDAQTIIEGLDAKIALLEDVASTTTSDLNRRMSESHALKLRNISYRLKLGMRNPEPHKLTFNAEEVRDILKAIVE